MIILDALSGLWEAIMDFSDDGLGRPALCVIGIFALFIYFVIWGVPFK